MEIFIAVKMNELHVTTQVNLSNIMGKKQVLEDCIEYNTCFLNFRIKTEKIHNIRHMYIGDLV